MLLDSDSNGTIICNKKYARNTWNATSNSLHVETHGGSNVTKQKCHIHDVGEHWFSAKSMTNVLPLSDVVDEHKVELDTNEERALKVPFPRKIVKLEKN